MDNAILKLSHIKKLYPGVVALDDVNIEFNCGEVHAICGENGAGKSTLIKVIAGAIQPDGGTICYEGKEYAGLNPTLSTEMGIHVVYQELNLIPGLTVAENLFLRGDGKFGYNKNEVEAKAQAVMDEWNLDVPVDQPIMNLTVGYQQLVEITKVISHENVKLVIMDEPTAPLTDDEVEKVYEIIAALKKKNIAVIYVSHRLEEVFQISDKITVMRDGKYITTVDTNSITRPELIKLMVGRDLSDDFPKRKTPVGDVILEAVNLCGNSVENINFKLSKGEILGFGGLLGAGRTELMELISGVVPYYSGSLRLKGKEVHFKNPAEAGKAGITMITEDRKQKGFFGLQPIDWNITISCLSKLSKGIFLNRRNLKETSDYFFNKLDVKAHGPEQLVGTLSGGNQQKVVVAKSMSTGAEILIFDEPTRGIDVGAKSEIYSLIREFSEEGKTIIMVSSEMKELIGLCDRIVVLSERKQAGILENPEEFTQEKILELATMFG